jgi:hypothetical protein
MKRLVIIAAALACFAALTAFAQAPTNTEESSLYVQTYTVMRIYVHQLGYRIDYKGDANIIRTAYAPLEWFQEAAGQGELVYERTEASPFLQVFWQDGEFSHFRLVARPNFNHGTWDNLDYDDVDPSVFDIDRLQIP